MQVYTASAILFIVESVLAYACMYSADIFLAGDQSSPEVYILFARFPLLIYLLRYAFVEHRVYYKQDRTYSDVSDIQI